MIAKATSTGRNPCPAGQMWSDACPARPGRLPHATRTPPLDAWGHDAVGLFRPATPGKYCDRGRHPTRTGGFPVFAMTTSAMTTLRVVIRR